MATVRTDVKTYIVDQLAQVLNGQVEVSRSWPGPNLARDHIWIDRASGTVTFPLMMAGRKTRQDEFTIWLVFQASGPGDTAAEVEARAEDYADVFGAWLADDPSLGDMAGIIHAQPGEVEGPDGFPLDEGHAAYVIAQLNVLSRLD